jgi:hypothetical protein
MTEIQFCVAPRKNGRPCRGIGRIFDPARNGLVCDAHAGPEINQTFQRRMKGLERLAEAEHQNWEKYQRDEDLRRLPEALSRFRDGKLLPPKTRKLLKGILAEDTHRKQAKMRSAKSREDL